MPPRMDFWTEQRVETLTGLWSQGLACSAIAERMGGGLSRSAIIGKVHRLKLTRAEGYEVRLRSGMRAKPQKVIRKEKRWAVNPSLADQIQRAEERKNNRALMISYGSTKTSSAYRKHLPKLGQMTRGELRAMLRTAVQNTANLGDFT